MVQSLRQMLGAAASEPTTADSVLIIVDAQNEYERGLLKIQDFDASISAINSLLQKYRAANGDIVHVLNDAPEGAPVLTPHTELALAHEKAKPGDGEMVIHKIHPNSFAATGLHEYLLKVGKKKIVLVGYLAHVCISGTARVGSELGYDVSVVRDAVGDRDIPGVEAGVLVKTVLHELEDAFATVLDSKDIV